jgi:hypothetical protein
MSVGICDATEAALDGPLDAGAGSLRISYPYGVVERERRFTKGVAAAKRDCTGRVKEDATNFTVVRDGAKHMQEDMRNATALLLILCCLALSDRQRLFFFEKKRGGRRKKNVTLKHDSSRNTTVANATSSAQRFLHNLRRWSAAPWQGLRLCMSALVSVGLPSSLDHVFEHHIRGLLVC